jgi:mono/diheme cytochrome c family protein
MKQLLILRANLSRIVTTLKLALFALLTALLISSQYLQAESATIIQLESESIQTALKKLPTQTLKLPLDPLYQRPQTYVGYTLRTLTKALEFELTDTSALRFHCRDGYKAIVMATPTNLENALLVSTEMTKRAGYHLENIVEGKELLNPEPFLLIWRPEFKAKAAQTRPYSIVAIEHGNLKMFLGNSYPQKNPNAVKGFEIFQNKCSSCHSINLQGGLLGPELNVPKNVTEYWTKENFFNFVLEPQSYRFRSRMPNLNLNQSELDLIYTYIYSMQTEKVCATYDECIQWEKSAKQPIND